MATKIQLRVTGDKGKVDGYVESMLGVFALSGQLLEMPVWNKRHRDNGIVQIYVNLVLKPPPLGHKGDGDIQEKQFMKGELE